MYDYNARLVARINFRVKNEQDATRARVAASRKLAEVVEAEGGEVVELLELEVARDRKISPAALVARAIAIGLLALVAACSRPAIAAPAAPHILLPPTRIVGGHLVPYDPDRRKSVRPGERLRYYEVRPADWWRVPRGSYPVLIFTDARGREVLRLVMRFDRHHEFFAVAPPRAAMARCFIYVMDRIG